MHPPGAIGITIPFLHSPRSATVFWRHADERFAKYAAGTCLSGALVLENEPVYSDRTPRSPLEKGTQIPRRFFKNWLRFFETQCPAHVNGFSIFALRPRR